MDPDCKIFEDAKGNEIKRSLAKAMQEMAGPK